MGLVAMTSEEVSAEAATADMIGLRVANLGFWLDARGAGLRLAAPPCHHKFLQPLASEVPPTSEAPGDLVLRVGNGPLPETAAGWTPLCLIEAWELWLDEAGCYVFVAPQQFPPRRVVVVDPGFTAGEVLGDFASRNGEAYYPLQGIDIMLFANWLASFGDVLLHAAGVAVDGRGYCFAGTSGVGKSTLAASLMSASKIAAEAATMSMGSPVMLGEDQVILRYLEGRFWIYGTPWHIDPASCSPLGVPLEKLFFLEQMGEKGVAPCTPLDGIARLLQTAFIPYYNRAGVAKILDRLALLAEHVPFYMLSYQLGSDPMPAILGA